MTKNRQRHRYNKPPSSSAPKPTNRHRAPRLRVLAPAGIPPGMDRAATANFIATTLRGDGYDPITGGRRANETGPPKRACSQAFRRERLSRGGLLDHPGIGLRRVVLGP